MSPRRDGYTCARCKRTRGRLKRCKRCRARMAVVRGALRAARRAVGLCTECGADAEKLVGVRRQKAMCARHLKLAAKRRRNARKREAACS